MDELYNNPSHPYTEALLAAIPVSDPKRKTKRTVLSGDMPSPLNPPSGCPFNPRCLYKKEKCTTEKPRFEEVYPGKWMACHYPLSTKPVDRETP